jgi:hypothetical protein
VGPVTGPYGTYPRPQPEAQASSAEPVAGPSGTQPQPGRLATLRARLEEGDETAREEYERRLDHGRRYVQRKEQAVAESGINRAQLEGVRAYLKATNHRAARQPKALLDNTLAQYMKTYPIPRGISSLTADVQPNQPFDWITLERVRTQLKKDHPNSEKLIDELGYDVLDRFWRNPNLDLLTELGRR